MNPNSNPQSNNSTSPDPANTSQSVANANPFIPENTTQNQYNDYSNQEDNTTSNVNPKPLGHEGNQSWSPEQIPQLTVDVFRDDENIYVVSTVAGINPEDIDISMENSILSIKGIRKKPYDDKVNTMLLEECFWGEFHRELTINENLHVDKIKASIDKGILTITIPILKISTSKRVQIEIDR